MIRIFELITGIVLFILLIPVMGVISVIGLFETGSPFFVQSRMGKNKVVFHLVKFRTMKRLTADLPTHLVSGDMVTKTGQFLRRTKLDELPQLINVINGTMSLVGPRPCLPTQIELIHERDKRNIFKMKPGITGIAQINNVDMSTPKRLARYDYLLLRKFSLRLYFYCLLATAFGKGQGDALK